MRGPHCLLRMLAERVRKHYALAEKMDENEMQIHGVADRGNGFWLLLGFVTA